jgi:two-component system invasion response regulator UvrY
MASATPIRVMLVDDHAVTRAGYRFLVDNLPDIIVVAEAANGEDALKFYADSKPDVVILDLSMPGMGGRQVLATLQKQWPESRVLVCTMHETKALIDHVMQSGAAGYISKNSSPQALVTAVRQIAGGDTYMDTEVSKPVRTAVGSKGVAGIESLSARELQVLCLFAEAYSIEDIATELAISSKTVANYLTVIKEKLQVGSTTELVRFAISNGLASIWGQA